MRRKLLDGSGAVSKVLPYGFTEEEIKAAVLCAEKSISRTNEALRLFGCLPVEALLDSAGLTGLVSKAICNGFATTSQSLVTNQSANGYPDLLLREDAHPFDKARSARRGLEVKASSKPAGWQAGSLRRGWHCLVQYEPGDSVFPQQNTTRIASAHVLFLARTDWKGRTDSGTFRLTEGAVSRALASSGWVAPWYRTNHDLRLRIARAKADLGNIGCAYEARKFRAKVRADMVECLRRLSA